MNYRDIVKDMIDALGGKENIKSVTHCFTRLRFVLRDNKKADKKRIEAMEGVISVVEAGGQFQVVCGAKVEKFYDEVITLLGEEVEGGAESSSGNNGLGNRILQIITQIFTPLVPAIAAAGLIKGLLTAAKLIFANYGIDIAVSDTYQILFNASQVIFYFMPIFLAFTAAKALKCNQVIAMVIGGLLCYPAFDAMIQNTEVATTIFGLPVLKGVWQIGESTKVFSYVESVIPILLVVFVMSYLEKGLKKVIPNILQIILVPGLELLIMIPLALVVLGPIGIYVGNGIQWTYESIMGISPILGGGLIGALWGVMVIFGAHRALLPIGLNDVAINGHQNILAFAGAANFAQGGASLGVLLKTKNVELKQVAASGTISAALVGITEPAIYGVNLRLKKPMIYAIIAGGIGGAIMGAGNVYGDAFANNGVLTIFTYAAFGMTKFVFYLVGIAVAFFGAAALTYFLGFDDLSDTRKNKNLKKSISSEKEIHLHSPITGEVIAIQDVEDEVFSSKAMGDGIAFLPKVGELRAPGSGVVTVLFPTLHAVGMKLDSGVECILHIGLDTVELKGQHFKSNIKEGDHVNAGDLLVEFDIEAIEKEGYSLVTPMVITNSNNYSFEIDGVEKEVNNDSIVLTLKEEV